VASTHSRNPRARDGCRLPGSPSPPWISLRMRDELYARHERADVRSLPVFLSIEGPARVEGIVGLSATPPRARRGRCGACWLLPDRGVTNFGRETHLVLLPPIEPPRSIVALLPCHARELRESE